MKTEWISTEPSSSKMCQKKKFRDTYASTLIREQKQKQPADPDEAALGNGHHSRPPRRNTPGITTPFCAQGTQGAMQQCAIGVDMAFGEHDLCTGSQHWAVALAGAWLTSPLACFFAFVLMRNGMRSARPGRPFILKPSNPAATAGASMRVVSLNMCLLPGGLSFSGSWLFDGDDRKEERIRMLLATLDDCDVLLLNEMWGCWWSSYHTSFFRQAKERGFYVCASPVRDPCSTASVYMSRDLGTFPC